MSFGFNEDIFRKEKINELKIMELEARIQGNIEEANELKAKADYYFEYKAWEDPKTEEERLNRINEKTYANALETMKNASTEEQYVSASKLFNEVSEYKNSKALSRDCLDKAEIARKDCIYNFAEDKVKEDRISSLETAIEKFSTIPKWRDSSERIEYCKKRLEELTEIALKSAKQEKIAIFTSLAITLAIIITIVIIG